MRKTEWVLVGIMALTGCTSANPAFSGWDTSSTDASVGASGDGASAVDDQGTLVDAGVGQPCRKVGDCDDGLACTVDTCDEGWCVHAPEAGTCAIDGRCWAPDNVNPEESCQLCDPTRSQTTWSSAADGIACSDDGFSCTADACSAGNCGHVIVQGCLIDGVCRDTGWSASDDPCQTCLPSQDKQAVTFVVGRACAPGTGNEIPGMCLADGCHGWLSSTLVLPDVVGNQQGRDTALLSVARLSSNNELWAVGSDRVGTESAVGGMLVRLAAGDSPPDGPELIKTTAELRAIHHRVAVGLDGAVYLHALGSWQKSEAIQTALRGAAREGVWGTASDEGESIYLVGPPAIDIGDRTGQVLQCAEAGASWSCTFQLVTKSDAELMRVWGVAGRHVDDARSLWALPSGSRRDIYAYSPQLEQWTRNESDGGCVDNGPLVESNACSGSGGPYRDLGGSGADDVWAVGDGGLILHWDGRSWSRVREGIAEQQSYNIDAVYSGASPELTAFVAHRDDNTIRSVVWFSFNRALAVWNGPVLIERFTINTELARLAAFGGGSYADLWLVGYRPRVLTSETIDRVGWILRLDH